MIAFHREVGLIGAKAAHGAADRIIGEDRLGLDIDVGHAVWAAGMAGGAQQALGAGSGVASRIAHDAGAHGEQMALGIGAQPCNAASSDGAWDEAAPIVCA